LTTEEIITNSFEEEWEEFQPAQVLSPEISGKLWNSINKNPASPAKRFPYLSWIPVAASLLLATGLSWYFIFKERKTSTIPGATVAKTQHIFNNTPQKTTLTLSDGSLVELLSNSTLSYPENFGSSKREVLLNGEANFNIAKDAARPFTVYSNSILITVLGTRFTVKPYEANNATKVILHEGRVMVKIVNPSIQDNKNEYYLRPGDIFISKRVKKQARSNSAEPIATPTSQDLSNDSLLARILPLEKDKDADCYVFNNYPLDVVFDQLQIIYDTKIIYDKAELGNRTFIGKIDKKDPIYNILKSIALLNKFGLHKQGDSFIIAASPN